MRLLPTPFWLFMLITVLPMPAAAVTVENLHDARVEVHGQGDAERAEGFREALEQVLLRMTGRAEVLTHADIEPLLDEAHRYVQTFRYQRIERDGEDREAREAADADDEELPTHYLDVSFSGQRLERMLNEHEIPLWSVRRPEVLVWIAIDDGRERLMMGEDEGDAARSRVRETARERGLPVLFPLLDAEDRRRVDFIDIRGRFYEALEHAGERYRTDLILVGHVVRRSDNAWEADWGLIDERARVEEWQARATSMEEVVDTGVHGATERVAAMMTLREAVFSAFMLRVDSLDSLSGYARVADYLHELDRVTGVSLVDVSGTTARFRVRFEGTEADLIRLVSRDGLLAPVGPTGDAASDEAGTGESVFVPADAPGEDAPLPEIVFRLTG